MNADDERHTDHDEGADEVDPGSRSRSTDGTTSGGIGSGATEGTGAGVGNWDEPGGTGSEDQRITYPTGTSESAVGDWSSRQAGSGREAGDQDPEKRT
ncbi:MAG: hypothetical protein ACR2K4_10600 [Candidatus Limnocylindria bacterium]